jgi:hypothetical protein
MMKRGLSLLTPYDVAEYALALLLPKSSACSSFPLQQFSEQKVLQLSGCGHGKAMRQLLIRGCGIWKHT